MENLPINLNTALTKIETLEKALLSKHLEVAKLRTESKKNAVTKVVDRLVLKFKNLRV
jgi:hypothetical protein